MFNVLERMKADLILAGKTKETARKYLVCCRIFLEHFARPVETLGRAEVRAFLVYLAEVRKLKPATRVQYQAGITFLFRMTLRRPEEVEAIPWAKVRRSQQVREVPTREEVEAILDCAPGLYWRTLFTTVYLTGMRRGEASELQVGDLNARAGLIHLRRGTKGDKPRDVLLTEPLLWLLRDYWRRMRPPQPWVFPRYSFTRGWLPGPARRQTMTDCLRRTREYAGIHRQVTLHSLRRAHATHLAEDGVPVPVIQALLGHVHMSTTMDYIRLSNEQIRLATEVVAKLLSRLFKKK